MTLTWSWDAWEDYAGFWHQSENRAGLDKIKDIIEELKRNPRSRGYNAELLKHDLQGWSAMRINKRDRFVYKAGKDSIEILSCRFHYAK